MKPGSLENSVLRRVKPSKREQKRLSEAVNMMKDRFKGLNARIAPQGSFAKGTNLRGSSDVDLFFVYPKSIGKERLGKQFFSDTLDRIKGLDYEIAYAEHPYIKVKTDEGVDMDLVPALEMKFGEKPITATDRTPLHTDFVNSHLDNRGKDDVRLLKRFMKGTGVYGAEIKVKGFSGYVAELLTIKYGSFKNVLKNASGWGIKTSVELVKPEKKFDEPLVIPDPVDPARNTASAVSLKNVALFSLAARKYLEKPNIKFFFPPDEPREEKVKGDVLITNLKIEGSVVEDKLWGQVGKSVDKLKKSLESAGYGVINVSAFGDNKEVKIVTHLESASMPKYKKIKGPMFNLAEAVDKFLEAHKDEEIFVGDDGRLYAVGERKADILDIVKNSISITEKYSLQTEWLHDGEKVSKENLKFIKLEPSWLRE